MKWTLVAVLAAVAACGANSETPEQRLIGTWVYANAADTSGLGVQFKGDSTYELVIMQLTSSTSANVEAETGVFSATDTELTFVPQQWTCPGPYPSYTVSYHFNGDTLVVTSSTGATMLSRDTSPPWTNGYIAYGCFQSNGSFVAEALAPVSN